MPKSITGRPQRQKMVNFRLSSSEFAELLGAATAHKMSVSEFCREAVVSGTNSRTPAARLKRIETAAEETLQMVRAIAAAANSGSGGQAK